MKKDSLYAALAAVQGALKCTKGQYNSFGEFKYRSAEDILEAVKPLLTKYGLYLRLSDEVLLVGDRYYIQATATAIETATGAQESASALAREPEEKKKLGASQVTGMASSYARKYALGGLFGIDDAKDADAYPAEEPPDYVGLLKREVSRLGLSWEEVKAEVQGRFEKTSLKELTPLEWTRLIEIYQERTNEYV